MQALPVGPYTLLVTVSERGGARGLSQRQYQHAVGNILDEVGGVRPGIELQHPVRRFKSFIVAGILELLKRLYQQGGDPFILPSGLRLTEKEVERHAEHVGEFDSRGVRDVQLDIPEPIPEAHAQHFCTPASKTVGGVR